MGKETTEIEKFYPSSKQAWRQWLQENHETKQAVWVIFYNKASQKPSLTWSESVDEALCFGWIDSKKVAIDHECAQQFFSKRKALSTWSKINKEKITRLIAEGLMQKAGYESIAIAKENGSWTLLDEVEELIIPDDLATAFESKAGSKDFFLSLSKSAKKAILQWIVLAKRSETRQNRIHEVAELASKKLKPKFIP